MASVLARFFVCLFVCLFVFPRSVTNRRLVSKAHASPVHAYSNLVPRAHVSFGQRQDTELLNNQFPDSKILVVPVSRRMRVLV